jgi:hypothetical protein
VFVIDLHALSAIDVLDFVQEILLDFFRTADLEDVLWDEWSADEGIAGSDLVARVHLKIFTVRNHVFNLRAIGGFDDDDSLAAFLLCREFDFAIDFGNNGWIAWLASLEEFSHSGRPPVMS